MERLKPARDPFFLEHQVTFVLIPAFLAAVMIAQTSAGILGSVAVVLTIFLLYILYRSRQRARIPFWRARDAWEKAEKARYERSLLERRDNLLNLAPRDLEHAVTHLFSTLGYDARVTRATGDGGWDVDLVRDGERTIVECKRYAREKPVGRPVIQKLHSARSPKARSPRSASQPPGSQPLQSSLPEIRVSF